jgi:hypothetical protein
LSRFSFKQTKIHDNWHDDFAGVVFASALATLHDFRARSVKNSRLNPFGR